MEPVKSVIFEGKVKLMDMLSHISHRQDLPDDKALTRFVVIPVIADNADGSKSRVELPGYSGNAFRGILRRFGAAWLLTTAGRVCESLAEVRFLAGGGSSLDKKEDKEKKEGKGKKVADGPDTPEAEPAANAKDGKKTSTVLHVAKNREIQARNPLAGLLGGTLPNRMLQGKLRLGNLTPICKETIESGLIPESVHNHSQRPSAIEMKDDKGVVVRPGLLFQKAFVRSDVIREPRIMAHVSGAAIAFAESAEGQAAANEKKGAADQQYIMGEYLPAGTELYCRMAVVSPLNAELGFLLHALNGFAQDPYIGGQNGKGCGRVELTLNVKSGGESVGTVVINGDGFKAEGEQLAVWMAEAETVVKAMVPGDFFPQA